MSVRDVDTANSPSVGACDQALVREKLWGAVADRDEYAAVTTIFAALDAGMQPEDILLEVIARVQYKIGTEWAANRITVAQEHRPPRSTTASLRRWPSTPPAVRPDRPAG